MWGEQMKLKDLMEGDYIYIHERDERMGGTVYIVGEYDGSDNTYWVYECGDVDKGMFLSAEKVVWQVME